MDVSNKKPIPVLDGFRFGLVSVCDFTYKVHTNWTRGRGPGADVLPKLTVFLTESPELTPDTSAWSSF